MSRLMNLFKKSDGAGVIKRWAHGHVLGFALLQTALLGTSRKSLEIMRLAVTDKLYKKMARKAKGTLEEFRNSHPDPISGSPSKIVWICWLSGLESAPEVARRCIGSLYKNLPSDHKIRFVTAKNYRDYVTFPEDIQSKIDAGIITGAHMTDLLRLELLINHGGTWMDATLLAVNDQIPGYMLDDPLFVFSQMKPGYDGHSSIASNWMISAWKNHPILECTRDLLYSYWRKNDHLKDYFIFHYYFRMASEAYPKLYSRIVPFATEMPHVILLRLFEDFDAHVFEEVTRICPLQKLSYKRDAADFEKSGTYYDWIRHHFPPMEALPDQKPADHPEGK